MVGMAVGMDAGKQAPAYPGQQQVAFGQMPNLPASYNQAGQPHPGQAAYAKKYEK